MLTDCAWLLLEIGTGKPSCSSYLEERKRSSSDDRELALHLSSDHDLIFIFHGINFVNDYVVLVHCYWSSHLVYNIDLLLQPRI
jgi:hypothetical protein